MRPAPPVASSVAFAWRIITSPVSISSATTPSTSPAWLRMRSSAIHSTKNCVRAATLRWYSVWSIACPVRSAAAQALVDLAVVEPVERHAHVLELDDYLDRLAAHELDRVLVAEVVGALDRVVHVPVPVVRLVVAERRGDPALRRDRVRARRKH